MTGHLRVLPVALPPVHGETIGSYLNRLADANHLPIGHLSFLIGPNRRHRRDDNRAGHWTPAALPRLAALTGQSVHTLIHAMPALAEVREPGQYRQRLVIEELAEPRRRPACHLCMARRGIHGLVVRSTPHHDGVCHRHNRWLHGGDQHHLDALPEILHAGQRHRRLVRRHKAPFTALDCLRARPTTTDWFKRDEPPALQQLWSRRLQALGEDPYGDPHRPTDDRIELATYPESVTPTGLFASPRWRERNDLHAEAARRLAIEAQDLPPDLTEVGTHLGLSNWP
ncbi:TniQ family protein [Streptomyces sp. CJ_13]|uniref:TniQ family protein n=1 Tax=Streptomyces sp. CJ_13 TaxID=2724943 RepID=UPI001BDBBEB4|nr:TniQ family protein [Streptomyces sp. CJ_13]MBT1187669.1 TniQ family protein [Streptomyces sp. CJ_13]